LLTPRRRLLQAPIMLGDSNLARLAIANIAGWRKGNLAGQGLAGIDDGIAGFGMCGEMLLSCARPGMNLCSGTWPESFFRRKH